MVTSTPIEMYVFRDTAFAPDGDTLVCIALESVVIQFIPKDELSEAFSGYVTYQNWPFKGYLGVWGRRNASRLRRFLRERGAELIINRGKPDGAALGVYATGNERPRVRSLPPRD